MYRTSIRLPQRCTQRDNRNSLVFAPNARLRSFALASANTIIMPYIGGFLLAQVREHTCTRYLSADPAISSYSTQNAREHVR